MKPVSDARRRRDAHYSEARDACYERAEGRCEVMAEGCNGTAQQVHHRRGRVPIGGDNPHNLELLVAICRPCHDYVEHNRAWAYEHGWLLSRMGTVTPPAWAQEDA